MWLLSAYGPGLGIMARLLLLPSALVLAYKNSAMHMKLNVFQFGSIPRMTTVSKIRLGQHTFPDTRNLIEPKDFSLSDSRLPKCCGFRSHSSSWSFELPANACKYDVQVLTA